MNRDIYLNKRQSIETCLSRAGDKYAGVEHPLNDLDRKEITFLNLHIDLAMHALTEQSLGVPQDSRDAFGLLAKAGKRDDELCEKMQDMVGSRNIAIHQYQEINDTILRRIIEDHLTDFTDFLERVKPRGSKS